MLALLSYSLLICYHYTLNLIYVTHFISSRCMLELKLAISRSLSSQASSVDAVHIAYMDAIWTEESLTQVSVQASSQHGLIKQQLLITYLWRL